MSKYVLARSPSYGAQYLEKNGEMFTNNLNLAQTYDGLTNACRGIQDFYHRMSSLAYTTRSQPVCNVNNNETLCPIEIVTSACTCPSWKIKTT